jgi:hypothetical protein
MDRSCSYCDHDLSSVATEDSADGAPMPDRDVIAILYASCLHSPAEAHLESEVSERAVLSMFHTLDYLFLPSLYASYVMFQSIFHKVSSQSSVLLALPLFTTVLLWHPQ